jgi:hypothetical protein
MPPPSTIPSQFKEVAGIERLALLSLVVLVLLWLDDVSGAGVL